MYGLVVLALFVIWLTALAATAKFVFRKAPTKARGAVYVFGVAAGFVFAAWFAYWYPLHNYAAKQATYLAYCEASALTVHAERSAAGFALKQVVDYDLNQSVADLLEPGGFDYVDLLDIRPGGGSLRLHRSSDGDPSCVLDDETNRGMPRLIAELFEKNYPESACLAATPVERGASRYLLTSLYLANTANRDINMTSYVVIDRQTGGILAERPFGSRNFRHPFALDVGHGGSCSSARGVTAELLPAALAPAEARTVADPGALPRPMRYEELVAWARITRTTALGLAVREPGVWIMRLLLASGYDVDAMYRPDRSAGVDRTVDVNGRSMLYEAITAEREDLVWFLFREGAPLDRPLGDFLPSDNYLYHAVRSSSVDVVDALLTARAWPEEVMDYVAGHALRSGDDRLRLAAVLIKHDADPDRLLTGLLFDRTAAAAPVIEYLFANGAVIHTEGPFAQAARYGLRFGTPETQRLIRAQLAKQQRR